MADSIEDWARFQPKNLGWTGKAVLVSGPGRPAMEQCGRVGAFSGPALLAGSALPATRQPE